MRELKFRAWNKIWGMMSLVDKIEFEEGKPVSISVTIEATDFDHTDEWSDYEVGDDIILQQYSGLKDKNGKEVYEGDIVEYKEFGESKSKKGVVVFETGAFGLETINGSFDGSFDYGIEELSWEGFEVIGNIYENPELLNNKK